ncbi:hook-length control protein FliK [Dyella sp. OK004]|uniref:flagellar hook-length control protein FliK n=1 Tax=Dyella sp. OK004 TaxID=1855292 RepID=UPI0008E553EC|nr:flagellar hook-length control protein FliK [Dyella sp. OK004]SFR85931.1 hook-length control protein FliK [Dyella sp. OK004]
MIIQPTSLAALTWAGAASGASAESWRVGAVLAARTLGFNEQMKLVLQIGALTVETEPPGTQLPSQFQVRVLSLGAEPKLEVLGSSPVEQTVSRALRERLPQQNGYAPLLATLGALAQRPLLRQLPPPLRAALALLEHSIRTPTEITHGLGLREAMKRSGLFLESQLAQPQTDLEVLGEDDWKAALLRLASTLERPSPPPHPNDLETAPPLIQRGLLAQPRAPMPEPLQPGDVESLLVRLHGEVHAALARLEVAQLEAHSAGAWMIEIPLQGEGGQDILQLQLTPNADDPEHPTAWTFGFAIDLPRLGPVQGELQLRGLRLSVRLWAQRAESVERLERRFAELSQQLTANGLILDQLTCQTGLPQPPSTRSAVLLKATA